MGDVGAQLALMVGVAASVLVGPFAGLFFLLRRKKKARALRRSPIAKALLRSPGHTLNEQLAEANIDVMGYMMLLMAFPPVLLAILLAQSYLRPFANTSVLIAMHVVPAVVVVAYGIRKLLQTGVRLDMLKAGYDAELAVGQELDHLMRQGAHVFHDGLGRE